MLGSMLGELLREGGADGLTRDDTIADGDVMERDDDGVAHDDGVRGDDEGLSVMIDGVADDVCDVLKLLIDAVDDAVTEVLRLAVGDKDGETVVLVVLDSVGESVGVAEALAASENECVPV